MYGRDGVLLLLTSRKGELLGSQKDYKMNTSIPNKLGIYFLESVGSGDGQQEVGEFLRNFSSRLSNSF